MMRKRFILGFVLALSLAVSGCAFVPHAPAPQAATPNVTTHAGYIVEGGTWLTYITWDETGDGTITGTWYTANRGVFGVVSHNASTITGSVAGDTVHIESVVEGSYDAQLQGNGSQLIITWTNTDGYIQRNVMTAATDADYNAALQQLSS